MRRRGPAAAAYYIRSRRDDRLDPRGHFFGALGENVHAVNRPRQSGVGMDQYGRRACGGPHLLHNLQHVLHPVAAVRSDDMRARLDCFLAALVGERPIMVRYWPLAPRWKVNVQMTSHFV